MTDRRQLTVQLTAAQADALLSACGFALAGDVDETFDRFTVAAMGGAQVKLTAALDQHQAPR